MSNTILKVNYENLKYILAVIRKATKAIKVFPFMYVVLFIPCYVIAMFYDFDVLESISACIYESPLFVAFLIYLSYAVKLCFWHRLQCTLPLIPQAMVFCDTYIYEYGEALAIINFAILIVIFLLSLINAYFVFIRPQRKSPNIL